MENGNWRATFVGPEGSPCLRFKCGKCCQEFVWGGKGVLGARVQHCAAVEEAPADLIEFLRPGIDRAHRLPAPPPVRLDEGRPGVADMLRAARPPDNLEQALEKGGSHRVDRAPRRLIDTWQDSSR